MTRPPFRFIVATALLAGALAACGRRDTPPPTEAARVAHKKAIAAAAQDRLLLQGFVKIADSVEARLPSLRRESRGFVQGDTNVIWFAFFAGDSLVALDETRRVPGAEENARYLYRGARLQYVALDRILTADRDVPLRTRLAFGYDTSGTLVATSKNVNDAAVPLDTAGDVLRIAVRADSLRARVLGAARAR